MVDIILKETNLTNWGLSIGLEINIQFIEGNLFPNNSELWLCSPNQCPISGQLVRTSEGEFQRDFWKNLPWLSAWICELLNRNNCI